MTKLEYKLNLSDYWAYWLDVCGNEKAIHSQFSEYRIDGEWFSIEPEILRFIANNTINMKEIDSEVEGNKWAIFWTLY